MHKGECPECRAWRLDGKPPFVHGDGCSYQITDSEITRYIDHEIDELIEEDRNGS